MILPSLHPSQSDFGLDRNMLRVAQRTKCCFKLTGNALCTDVRRQGPEVPFWEVAGLGPRNALAAGHSSSTSPKKSPAGI
jgi:hypothetical protein